MAGTLRKSLIILLSILFLTGMAGLLRSVAAYQQGDEAYAAAMALAGVQESLDPAVPEEVSPQESLAVPPLEPPSGAAPLSGVDVAALQAVNPDVIGWIEIPDTGLSYPLVQGADNDYYLSHTWQNTRSAVGSIFMDFRSSADLSDFNTILYGHNMNNGTMFGYLHQFQDPAFLAAHPCLYIADDEGNSRTYRIFAVYEVRVSTAESYVLSFADTAEKQAFLDACLALSAMDTGVVPTVEDRIVTLSTCTGRGHTSRWVVQAVLEG